MATIASAQDVHLTMRGPEPPLVTPLATAVIELDVLGAADAQITGALPAIDGLSVALAPGLALDGGRGTRLRISLTPQRTGTFALPPFAIAARGQSLLSRSATLECATGVRGSELAFLEVDAPVGPVFLGAPFVVTLRIGIERAALARQLIQLFPQRLDVPVQLQAPWLSDLAGATPADSVPALALATNAHAALVLDGAVTKAMAMGSVERDGKTFAVFELSRAFVGTALGTVHIPASLLRFSWATRFQEDAIADPIPLDRQNGVVLSTARDLTIASLPREGQPAEFGGAVGTFRIATRAEPLELTVGHSVHLDLAISGEGNLAQLSPPALDTWPGLALQGRSEQTEGTTRTLRYDFVVTATKVFEIPAVALPYFDPLAGSYRTAKSEPIPLRVERLVGTPTTPPNASAPAQPEPAATAKGVIAAWSLGCLATGLLLLWAIRRFRR
jgi:hypothetical protein